jgi:autophagy-related protein 33
MDSSFEVVGGDSEGTVSEGAASEEEEEINGEEVRERIEVFRLGQTVRSVVAGIAFVMSILGIWGDGAVDVVVLEV